VVDEGQGDELAELLTRALDHRVSTRR
jgi:hypothetical protein